MSDEPEGFARRWSRLKRQVPAPEPVPLAVEPPMEEPPPAESIPLEEIASWMSRRVPDAWRQIALRRLWVSDPTIAGFIGPADYAWDWNTPGGAPGWGPLRAIDDVAKLLARAIGEPLPPVAPEPPPEQDAVAKPAEIATIEVESLPPSDPPEPSPARRRGGGATPV